ncbi:hypothetical protein ACWIUA_01285 [Ursidibacter sp. B-7004-1]
MPVFIWTITDYFFYKRKDLYAIKFEIPEGEEREDHFDLEARKMILQWFEENLPDIEIRPIYLFLSQPHILSTAYHGEIAIEFDEKSLEKFTSRWEDETGKSLDERFQCYLYSFDGYVKHHNGVIPDPNEMYKDI